jgi:hypothetical protein
MIFVYSHIYAIPDLLSLIDIELPSVSGSVYAVFDLLSLIGIELPSVSASVYAIPGLLRQFGIDPACSPLLPDRLRKKQSFKTAVNGNGVQTINA